MWTLIGVFALIALFALVMDFERDNLNSFFMIPVILVIVLASMCSS